MFLRCFLFFCILLLGGCELPPEQSFLISQGVTVDPKGQLTIDDIQAKPFKTIAGPIGRGYTPTATWLKLEIAASDKPLVLSVQPMYLDNLQLYSPAAAGAWKMQQLGDTFPYCDRLYKSVFFAFEVPPSAKPTTHYLRLSTTSTSLILVKVRSQEAAEQFDANLHFSTALYLGFLSFIFLTALLYWVTTRQMLWLTVAAMQLATMALTFVYLGFAAKYLFPNDPQIPNQLVGYTGVLHLWSVAWFHYVLYKSFKPPRIALLNYALLTFLLCPLEMAILMLGNIQLAMTINAWTFLGSAFYGAIFIWWIRPQDIWLRWTIRVVQIVLMVFIVYYAGPLLGLTALAEHHVYPLFLPNLWVSVAALFLLLRRDQLLKRAATKSIVQAAALAQQPGLGAGAKG